MTTYYDEQHDTICTQETYGDVCKVDDYTNRFLREIKQIMQTNILGGLAQNVSINDPEKYRTYVISEKKFIEFLCNNKTIYPISMCVKSMDYNKNANSLAVSLGKITDNSQTVTTIVKQIVASAQAICTEINSSSGIIDSDPTTNRN